MPITLEPVAASKNSVPTRKNLDNIDDIRMYCPQAILNSFQHILEKSPVLGTRFFNPYTQQEESFPQDAKALTARHLQLLARNESSNTDGVMKVSLYNGLLTEDDVARIRCLAKGMTVAGLVNVYAYGGFKSTNVPLAHPETMMVIDQSGLQWQEDFRNTGGLLFYPYNPKDARLPSHYATWQQDMYKVLYEKSRPVTPSQNILPVIWKGVEGVVDLNEVQNAIAVEFLQALDSTVHQAHRELKNEKVNFKFLKAGMGFFANGIVEENTRQSDQLSHARLKGIEAALLSLKKLPPEQRNLGKIKRLELPFSYQKGSEKTLRSIQALTEALGLEWGGVPNEDALTPRKGFVNATTNCGDPHAMIGNEGGHQSVDASIATNAQVNTLNMGFHKTPIALSLANRSLAMVNDSIVKAKDAPVKKSNRLVLMVGVTSTLMAAALGWIFFGPMALIAVAVYAVLFAVGGRVLNSTRVYTPPDIQKQAPVPAPTVTKALKPIPAPITSLASTPKELGSIKAPGIKKG